MVVVTLGLRLDAERAQSALRGRVDVGIEALDRTDAEYLVFTGGRTNPEVSWAECDAMQEYAIEQDVDPARILLEDQASDTLENGYYTRVLVEDLDQDPETIYLVSSCYHMERATYVFRQCFGAEYEIDATHCYDQTVSADTRRNEQTYLERHRGFFSGVTPGDRAAIEARLSSR